MCFFCSESALFGWEGTFLCFFFQSLLCTLPNSTKSEKGKVKTAVDTVSLDVSPEFAIQLKQWQQQIGNLWAK